MYVCDMHTYREMSLGDKLRNRLKCLKNPRAATALCIPICKRSNYSPQLLMTVYVEQCHPPEIADYNERFKSSSGLKKKRIAESKNWQVMFQKKSF